MAVIVPPSARRRIIRARRSSPRRMVVDRCHARSVWRSAGVRVILREVVRPRAIPRPSVRHGETVTPWGSRRSPGTMGGKAHRNDSTGGRQPRGAHKGTVGPDGAPGSRAPSFWPSTTPTLYRRKKGPPPASAGRARSQRMPSCATTSLAGARSGRAGRCGPCTLANIHALTIGAALCRRCAA